MRSCFLATPWPAVAAVAAITALLGAGPAQGALTVYRCGNVYADTPCVADPRPLAIVDDAATADARLREGRRVAAAERLLAADMTRDRREREAAKPAVAGSLGPSKAAEPPAAASASLKPKKKAKGKIRVVDSDDFVARVPKAQQPKTAPKAADPR